MAFYNNSINHSIIIFKTHSQFRLKVSCQFKKHLSRFSTLSLAVCKSPKAQKAWITNFVYFFVFWASFSCKTLWISSSDSSTTSISLAYISRHFCYFKVRGSYACHGIYFVFHGNTRDTRVLPWNTKYIPWHTLYAWDWVKCSEKSHCHVVQIGIFDWTIWIWGIIFFCTELDFES